MTLNLSKYISEVAAAITEAKLKMADIHTAVEVCSALHRRYAEFSPLLLENWQKVLSIGKHEKVIFKNLYFLTENPLKMKLVFFNVQKENVGYIREIKLDR